MANVSADSAALTEIAAAESDFALAKKIEQRLRRYRIPKRLLGSSTRLGKVPDTLDNLKIWKPGDSEETHSRFMIVVCSPSAARCPRLDGRIREFKRRLRGEGLLAIIVEGVPNASDSPHEEIRRQECFPPGLRFQLDLEGGLTDVLAEPIAADTRSEGDGWPNAIVKLVAGLIGVGYDDLKQRDQQRRQARIRNLIGVTGGLVILTATLAIFAFASRALALSRRSEAIQATGLARLEEEKSRKAEVVLREKLVADRKTRAGDAWKSGNPGLAALQNLQALKLLNSAPTRLVGHDDRVREQRILLGILLREELQPMTLAFGAPLNNLIARDGVSAAHMGDRIHFIDVKTGLPTGAPVELGEKAAPWIDMSDDGAIFSFAARQPEVAIWNPREASLLRTVDHGGEVNLVDVSPSGDWLMTAGTDRRIRLWRVASGELVQTFSIPNEIRSAVVHPEGRSVAVLDSEGWTDVLAASDSKSMTNRWQSPNGSGIQFSPSGDRLLTTHREPLWGAEIREVESGEHLVRVVHDMPVLSAAFSPDGKWLVTTSYDNTARLWEAATGKAVGNTLEHDHQVNWADFSPDGKKVVTSSRDRTAKVWSVPEGILLEEALPHPAPLYFSWFADEGKRIVSASEGESVRIWAPEEEREADGRLLMPEGGEEFVFLDLSADGRFLATLQSDGTIGWWDLAEGKIRAQSGGPGGEILQQLEIDREGRWIYGVRGNGIVGWNNDEGDLRSFANSDDAGPIRFIELSPTGDQILAVHDDGTRLYEIESGKVVGAFLYDTHDFDADKLENGTAYPARWTMEGDSVVQVEPRQMGFRLRAAKGELEPISPLAEFPRGVPALKAQVHPGGDGLLTYTGLGAARWRMGESTPMWQADKSWGATHVGRFSSDGERFLLGSLTGKVQVFESQDGTRLGSSFRHPFHPMTKAIFADGSDRVISHGANGFVAVSDGLTGLFLAKLAPQSGKMLNDAFTIQRTFARRMESLGSQGVVFSPEIEKVAALNADGSISLWDLRPTDLSMSELEDRITLWCSQEFGPSGRLRNLNAVELEEILRRVSPESVFSR